MYRRGATPLLRPHRCASGHPPPKPGASGATPGCVPQARSLTPSRSWQRSFPLKILRMHRRHRSEYQEDGMKIVAAFCSAAILTLAAAPAARPQANQSITPGTQVRVTLSEGLSTRIARNGDPFTGVVAEPVFSGNQMLLPAGAKIHGTVTGVERPKWISMFRGGASINLVFNSIEVESRIFPARMSILSIYQAGSDDTKRRKDLSTVEGVVVQERQDLKNDVEDVAIGTAGGSAAGVVFSRVLRGTIIGLVGGSAYVVAKKGKDVELPAQTGMLVRMDSNVSVPSSLLHNAVYTPGMTASGGN